MSAAGRPLIGLLPQGSAGSDFGKGSAGFDLGTFVSAAFAQLTADKAWDADGSSGDPPTPGRATLSGHSGADQPITQMLSGGKANDLAGLFLFDTMYVTDAEKKAKKKLKVPTPDNWKLQLEGKVEAYVKARFDADLMKIQAAKAADRRGLGRAAGVPAERRPRPRERPVHRVVGSAPGPGDRVDRRARSGGRRRRRHRRDPQQLRLQDGRQGQDAHGGDGRRELRRRDRDASARRLPPVPSRRRRPVARRCSGRRRRCCRRPATGPPQASSQRSPVAAAGPVAVQRDDAAPAPVDHAAEFAAFNVRGAIEGGLEGYKGIREVFIDTFGSITRANTYYAGVRQMPFLGRSPTVHASTLGAKLASAEQVLTDKGWRGRGGGSPQQGRRVQHPPQPQRPEQAQRPQLRLGRRPRRLAQPQPLGPLPRSGADGGHRH